MIISVPRTIYREVDSEEVIETLTEAGFFEGGEVLSLFRYLVKFYADDKNGCPVCSQGH